MKFTPQRAADTNEKDLKALLDKGPLWAFIKHDGVRAFVHNSQLLGKAMLAHSNKEITTMLSDPLYEGMDGELINTSLALVKDRIAYASIDRFGYTYDVKNVARLTSAMANTADSKNLAFEWYVFDWYHPTYTFAQRYEHLLDKTELKPWNPVRILPYKIIDSIEELLAYETNILSMGFEGLVLRNPTSIYEQGRSSKKGAFLRLKRYITAEMIVTSITTMQTNLNPSKINALGLKEKSSHKANKVDKENIGTFCGVCAQDVLDPYDGSLLIKQGTEVTCSATSMPRSENEKLYKVKDALIGSIIKFKFFPKGIKIKPRFATFDSFVSSSDFNPLP